MNRLNNTIPISCFAFRQNTGPYYLYFVWTTERGMSNNRMLTVLKSVLTADTFFSTEHRDLKFIIAAYRLAFWNRNTAS